MLQPLVLLQTAEGAVLPEAPLLPTEELLVDLVCESPPALGTVGCLLRGLLLVGLVEGELGEEAVPGVGSAGPAATTVERQSWIAVAGGGRRWCRSGCSCDRRRRGRGDGRGGLGARAGWFSSSIILIPNFIAHYMSLLAAAAIS